MLYLYSKVGQTKFLIQKLSRRKYKLMSKINIIEYGVLGVEEDLFRAINQTGEL